MNILNENKFHYSVLKSSCYQLLDSGIKNMVIYFKKLIWPWSNLVMVFALPGQVPDSLAGCRVERMKQSNMWLWDIR